MKTCTKCEVNKPVDAFAFQFKAKGKRFSRCRQCRSEEAKARWASGSQKEKNYANKAHRLEQARDYVWDYFLSHPCADCQESNPLVLEFDHLGDKFADVGRMVTSNYSLQRIRLEIDKCEVVCANCHKIRTSTRGNHWRSNRLTK